MHQSAVDAAGLESLDFDSELVPESLLLGSEEPSPEEAATPPFFFLP